MKLKKFEEFNGAVTEGFWDWLLGRKEDEPAKTRGEQTYVIDKDVEEFYKTLLDFANSGKSITVQSDENFSYSKVVENIQVGLTFLGYDLSKYGVDGYFGPETAGAIQKFNTDTKTDTSTSVHESLIKSFENWKSSVYESEITDLSDESVYPYVPMKNNQYFVIHHTAGLGTAQGVVGVLNARGPLSVQWIVDTEGKIYRGTKPNAIAAHAGGNNIMPQVKNSNAQGVEVVGKNDDDIKQRAEEDIQKYGYPRQAEAVRKIIKYLGYDKDAIFGHGELTTNKAPNEGATIKQYVLDNWDKPVDLSGFEGDDLKAGDVASNQELTTTIDSDLIVRLINKLMEKGFSQKDLDKFSTARENPSIALNVKDFDGVVAQVIDKLEGGYYHPDMLADGRVKDSRYGNSGETMMGIDRKAGGSINTTPEGIEFWNLIDAENARTNWKWGYRGGQLEDKLRELAGKMIKNSYDKYAPKFLSPKALEIVNNDPKLLFNFVYCVWNGPGWFQKFAQPINDAVANGITDPEELAKIAVRSRLESGNSLIAQGGRKIDDLLGTNLA